MLCKWQVSDCAEHPADIKVSTWSEVTCATCDEQDYNGEQPSVSCFDGDIESTPTPSTGTGTGSDSEGRDEGEDGDDDYGDESLVSPVPSSVGSEDDDDEGMNIMVIIVYEGFHCCLSALVLKRSCFRMHGTNCSRYVDRGIRSSDALSGFAVRFGGLALRRRRV